MNYNGNLGILLNFIVDVQESVRLGTDNKYLLSCVLMDRDGRKIARFGIHENDCPTSLLPRTVSKNLIINGGIIIYMPHNELILSEIDSAYWSYNDVNVCDDMVVITGKDYPNTAKYLLRYVAERNKNTDNAKKYTDIELTNFMRSKQNLIVKYQLFEEIYTVIARIVSFDRTHIFLDTHSSSVESFYRYDIIEIK